MHKQADSDAVLVTDCPECLGRFVGRSTVRAQPGMTAEEYCSDCDLYVSITVSAEGRPGKNRRWSIHYNWKSQAECDQEADTNRVMRDLTRL
jgi:hypothetical protein